MCYLQMIQTIERTYEHLARVAVFVDQARIGESLAINEHYSYERQFERLEDHHEHGLYWLLCAVQRLVHVTGSRIADHVVDGVSRMRVVEVRFSHRFLFSEAFLYAVEQSYNSDFWSASKAIATAVPSVCLYVRPSVRHTDNSDLLLNGVKYRMLCTIHS